jgi:UDP-glucose 4-epimerase
MSRLVIVTGARGAIGRHVVRQLTHAGDHRVLGLGHGARDATVETSDWINGTIDAANLSALANKWGRPDAIIHLAGGSAVGPSLISPMEDFERTTETGVRLLEWTRISAPDAALVFASSAAVYGASHTDPIPESSRRTPCSPYGFHKAMMEMAAQSWATSFGVKVAIVRLFSVYGPDLRKQLIYEQVRKLLSGTQRILLGGTGEEARDWLYIADAARLLIDAIQLADVSAPVVNGCTGRGTTVAETIAALAAAARADVEVQFSGISRSGDPNYLVGDPSQLAKAGFCAATALSDGLRDTLEWAQTTPG